MAQHTKSLVGIPVSKPIRVPVFINAGTIRKLDALAAQLSKEYGYKHTRSDAIRRCIMVALAGNK